MVGSTTGSVDLPSPENVNSGGFVAVEAPSPATGGLASVADDPLPDDPASLSGEEEQPAVSAKAPPSSNAQQYKEGEEPNDIRISMK